VLVKTHRPETINLASSADVCPELEPPDLPSLGQPGLESEVSRDQATAYKAGLHTYADCAVPPVGFFTPRITRAGNSAACMSRQTEPSVNLDMAAACLSHGR
jgi:hypothetical protein